MIRISLIILITVFSTGIFGQSNVSHMQFSELLQKYVDNDGLVNYQGFKRERAKLKAYLQVLEKNPPQSTWKNEEKLAFWINAYNAFTIELILNHYQVESIKDIGSIIKIPFVSTAWDIKFIKIGDDLYDLNNIEHGIIRKEFNEPRIHFALVCAALSCPKLLNKAYFPETLDAQLTNAAKQFLSDTAKNEIMNAESVKLSKLFNWYGSDFNNSGSLIEFINQYSPVQLTENTKIDWLDYNWDLNEQ